MQLMRAIGWPSPSWSELGMALGGALGLLGLGSGLAVWLTRDRRRTTPWQSLNQRVHQALESLGLPSPTGAKPASASSWVRVLAREAQAPHPKAEAPSSSNEASSPGLNQSMVAALMADLRQLDALRYGPTAHTQADQARNTVGLAKALVRQLELRCRQATSNQPQAGANSSN
jgi:hypothetical protein